jgi:hypothetical protein
MFPVYFQGSVVGAILGIILILSLATILIRNKSEGMKWFSNKYRWLVATAILVSWTGSFVNIGLHQVEGDRARFDQAGTLTEKNIPKVTRDTPSPESARKAADESRKEIDAGNLNK